MRLPQLRVLPLLLAASCATAPVAPPTPTQASPPPGGDVFGDTAFAGDPAAILEAMRLRMPPDDAPVEVLLESARLTFDGRGGYDYRFRRIYRVLTPGGAKSWSMLQAVWAPWRQSRPELDARVITATGKAFRLDPASIGEGAVRDAGPRVLTDSRKLQAPLPAMDVGAIVEETIHIAENRPPLGEGTGGRYWLGDRVPVARTRLVLDAPRALPLRWRVYGREDRPSERTEAGRTIVALELGATVPLPAQEDLVPADVVQWPYLEWSTGESWKRLARSYAEVVDSRIADAGLARLVADTLSGAKDRAEKIDRLLAKVQELVRYTGVEFGAAAVVPRTPGETLARHYGDCKDKAALLVAMLREAGIDAHVALLSSGRGPDVTPELPNFSLFDHAIVHVPGRPDLWIDPTYEFFRAGEVPPPDQGRWALVAARGTDALVRVPVADSTWSRVRRDRVLRMGELGRSDLELTFRYEGAVEADVRRGFSSLDADDFRDSFGNYVSERFLGKAVEGFAQVPFGDLGRTFEIRLTAKDVVRGYADGITAGVALQRLQLFDWLPDLLTERLDAGEDGLGERRHDLGLWVPYRSEIRYVVHPPAGYRVTSLPEDETVSAGPARYEARHRQLDDGTLEAVYTFDTGPGRFTPEELSELYDVLRRIHDAEPLMVELRLAALDDVSRGRVREGLRAMDDLVERHPGEGLHHAQRALLLLELGFGRSARQAARKAVEVEADSGFAWSVLGRVLDHDRFGRLRGPGWDREGALAAWRRAVALDTEDSDLPQKLALALEHDAAGRRFATPPEDLRAAAQAWREARRRLESDALDDEILLATYRAGDLDAVVDADDVTWNEETRALRLAALAARDGVEAALARARQLHPRRSERAGALRAASALLSMTRHYEAAVALLEAGLAELPDPGALPALQTLRTVRRHETLPPLEPHLEIVRELMRVIPLSGERRLKALRALVSVDLAAEGDRSLLGGFGALEDAVPLEVSPEVVLDFTLSTLELRAEGSDEHGWRVRARMASGGSGADFSLFVVATDDGYRLAGAPEAPVALARRALRLAEAGDLAGARQWLDWIREEMGTVRSKDPATAPAFPDLWRKGDPDQDLEDAKLAAASLLVLGDPARAVPVLKAATVESDLARAAVNRALMVGAMGAEDWKGAVSACDRLLETYRDAPAVLGAKGLALVRLGRLEEAEALARALLAESPHDEEAAMLLSSAAVKRGDVAAAAEALRKVTGTNRGSETHWNNLAWMMLVAGEDLDEAIRIAERAADLSRRRSRYALHTLASLYADAGRSADAWRIFGQLLELSPGKVPGPEDWYVYGRIAQSYGLYDEAERAYAEVPKADSADATYRLVERARRQLAEARRKESRR